MKTMEFKYTDLKDGRVLVEVVDFNKNYFNGNFYEEWEYGNIDYAIHTLERERGFIELYIKEDKLVGVKIGLGIKNTFSIISEKYVYIFKDLENKVFNIEENKLLDVLKIKEGDYYYFVNYDDYNNNFYIDEGYNYNSTEEINSELLGNIFKTKESAEDFIKELEKLFIERKQKLLEVG